MGKSGSGRIASLDGFRAISILMVLFGHLSSTRSFPVSLETYKNTAGDLAHLGVLVFFVISGFLITSLLMSEREKTGTISLKKFYLRRVLRIFPAFYALILALIVANLMGWISLSGHDLAYALTYTVNYDPSGSWPIGHLWSLSIEEQFYLLWPLTLLLLRQRRALMVAIAAIFMGPLVRAGILEWVFHVNPHSALANMSIFPAMFDYLATGCALALLRPWLLTQAWYLRLTGSRWLVLAVVLTFLINRLSGYTLVMLLGSPVMNVCIALLIESSTRHADSLAGRFLNWKPIAFVGVLSYSLYLWQQPFLDRHSDAWVTAFPQNLVLAFAAALLSYFVVERSFLGLRRRLERTTSLPVHTDSVRETPAEELPANELDPGYSRASALDRYRG
ncbi:MAG TPA: acyltransferase [Gammaproteobacteria bacterium]|nr:acyltransferase [Gammaproteobacteria bacterium]